MSNLIVHGGTPLRGRITPSANKNAVLPVLCATLLTQAPLTLHGVPDITDVRKILDIFRTLGSDVRMDQASGTLELHHKDTAFDAAAHRLPEEMRSSIMLVPPLLARFGVARLEDNVKGCTLGVREIDPHVEVFRSFGGAVERAQGSLLVRCDGPLHATHHWLDYASVTTTENFVLCAASARGVSTLNNAASEPHVQEFCRFMACASTASARRASRCTAARRWGAASSASTRTSTRSPPSWPSGPSPAATWWCATARRRTSR
ncbi:hypothetical protein AVTE2539_19975 [Acidovorax sp. SUPP2539]|nr:hypothetical protein AVTE2539_19975 [Acidovorax sp. SUPP2539]